QASTCPFAAARRGVDPRAPPAEPVRRPAPPAVVPIVLIATPLPIRARRPCGRSPPLRARRSFVGYAEHLLDARQALHDLHQPGTAQIAHALALRLLRDLQRVAVRQDDLLRLLADRHHLVDADAPLVAGAAAALAADRAKRGPRPVEVGFEKARLQQHRGIRLERRLARAQAARQALR